MGAESMAEDAFTYGHAVDLLHAFLGGGQPVPDADGGTPTARVLTALRDRSGPFSPGFHHEDEPVSEAIWQKAAKTPGEITPAPLFDVDDVLSMASTLAFAIPKGGVALSAVLGESERVLRRLEQRAAGRPRRVGENPIKALADDMKRFYSARDIETRIDPVAAKVSMLKSLMAEMLPGDPATSKWGLTGLDASYVEHGRTKESVLARGGGLGLVWDLIESDAFRQMTTEGIGDPGTTHTPALNLIEPPTLGMCTIGFYCRTIQTIVDALRVYATVCLLPEAAFEPGWDPMSFNLTNAVRSEAWTTPPGPGDRYATACDCWRTLHDDLNPLPRRWNWTSRAHPVHGDAEGAWHLIKTRLDRISLELKVPAFRDGRWYLAEDTTVHHSVPQSASEGANSVFRGACTGPQHEVRDTALDSRNCDGFATPYNAFTTTLTIDWEFSEDPLDTILKWLPPTAIWKWGQEGFEKGFFTKSYGKYSSPWTGLNGTQAVDGGEYEQVCWGLSGRTDPELTDLLIELLRRDAFALERHDFDYLMYHPIGRAMVAWLGFVLAEYSRAMSYEIYADAGASLVDYVKLCYAHWTEDVHPKAAALLAAGPRPTSRPPAAART